MLVYEVMQSLQSPSHSVALRMSSSTLEQAAIAEIVTAYATAWVLYCWLQIKLIMLYGRYRSEYCLVAASGLYHKYSAPPYFLTLKQCSISMNTSLLLVVKWIISGSKSTLELLCLSGLEAARSSEEDCSDWLADSRALLVRDKFDPSKGLVFSPPCRE